MNQAIETIATTLPDQTKVFVQITPVNRGGEVAFSGMPEFASVSKAIESITGSLLESLKKLGPQKATISFGVSMTLDAGKLAALLVQGSSEANLNITLEWEKQPEQ